MPFYQPDSTNPQIYDQLGNKIDYTAYKNAGGAGIEGGPASSWTDIVQGAPSANGVTTSSPLVPLGSTQQDPISLFNMELMKLLQKAQGANSGNPALAGQAENLQNKQITSSMAPASELGTEGLAPGDAMSARQNEAQLYNPEVKSLNARMQLNNEAVTRFEKTLDAATKMGEQYAKMLKPSEATVEAIKMQMRAGVLPSEDVLTKVQGQLTQEDWDAYVAAKSGKTNAPTSVQEYEYAQEHGYKGGYEEWLIKKANMGDNGPKDTTVKDYETFLSNEIDNLRAGAYGKTGAREKLITAVEKKYPTMDVKGDVYVRVPDGYETNIKSNRNV